MGKTTSEEAKRVARAIANNKSRFSLSFRTRNTELVYNVFEARKRAERWGKDDTFVRGGVIDNNTTDMWTLASQEGPLLSFGHDVWLAEQALESHHFRHYTRELLVPHLPVSGTAAEDGTERFPLVDLIGSFLAWDLHVNHT